MSYVAPVHLPPDYAHSTYTIIFLGLIVLWTQASIDAEDKVNVSFVASATEPGAMILVGLLLLFVLHFLAFPFIVNCFNPAIEYAMLKTYLPDILVAIKYFAVNVAIPLLFTCLTTAAVMFIILRERLNMQKHVLPLFLVVGTVLFAIG